MPQGKYLAGGLQSGCTANSIGAQYNISTGSLHNCVGFTQFRIVDIVFAYML